MFIKSVDSVFEEGYNVNQIFKYTKKLEYVELTFNNGEKINVSFEDFAKKIEKEL